MELRLESENRWVLSNTDQESKIGCASLYQIFASEWIFKTSLVTSAVLRLRYRLVSPADYWVQSRQRIFLATAHLTWSCGVCFSLKQEEALKAEETVRRATQRHGTIRILSRPNASNSTHLQLNLEIILSIWRPKVHAEKKDRNRFLLEHGPHFVGFAWGRSTCGQRHLCPPWKAILGQK